MALKIGQFRLGLRTLKTVLALVLIIIVMKLTGRGDSGTMIAGVSAVVVLRDSFKGTVKAAPARLIGQALGGALAILYFALYEASGYHFLIKVLLIALSVLAIIVLLDGFNFNAGIVGGNATFLMIVLSIPVGSAISYSIDRVFDSFIGVLIAIIINAFLVEDGLVKIEKKVEDVIEKIEKDEENNE